MLKISKLWNLCPIPIVFLYNGNMFKSKNKYALKHTNFILLNKYFYTDKEAYIL